MVYDSSAKFYDLTAIDTSCASETERSRHWSSSWRFDVRTCSKIDGVRARGEAKGGFSALASLRKALEKLLRIVGLLAIDRLGRPPVAPEVAS